MQEFKGVPAKLERAKESIFNLEAEIATFFDEGDYPILPEDDGKLLLDAIDYHRNRVIPLRFSVLAGEIIHHLRSCLDHIVWHFSVGATQSDRWIEFPVFKNEPIGPKDRSKYERKIERVQDPKARDLIGQVQPYNAANALDDPLWIIHHFDVIDKHRELVVCVGTGARFFPPEMQRMVATFQKQHPELGPVQVAHHFKGQGSMRPYVSFTDFGRREIQPVIPGLAELFNHTVNTVNRFAAL